MADENVAPRAFRPNNIKAFPAFYWDAKGNKKLINSAAEVPDGYTPYHPKDAEAAEKAKGATPPAPKPAKPSNIAPPRNTGAPNPPPPPGQKPNQVLPERKDIIAELTKRNLKFNAQSPTKALFDLLQGYIEANEA